MKILQHKICGILLPSTLDIAYYGYISIINKYAKGREVSKLQIINDSMTLSEKLSAISAAMKAAQQVADDDVKQKDLADIAPADSALVTIVSGE